ncbi:MAG: hypothetical protein ACJ76N_30430 [Thermoanaerobaculia bacterium]
MRSSSSLSVSALAATLLLFLASGKPAHGQLTRTWVSVNGNNVNDCSRATPCRTLSGALAKTSAGGEIDILDSGDFGSATLNKTISVIAPGVLGGLQTGSGAAITINAGSSDKIVLRGLTIDGLGAGLDGVSFVAGGSLYVENCTINNFTRYGLDFSPANGNGKLFLTDTVVRNNGSPAGGGGVHLNATTGAGFIASVDGLRSENNVVGLRAETLGVVTVRNSLSANNGFSGFTAVTPAGSGNVRLFIENSVSTHNGTTGIASVGVATVFISNLVVTNNQTGLAVNSGGAIVSFGNNRIQGNTTDGSPTQTILQQ